MNNNLPSLVPDIVARKLDEIIIHCSATPEGRDYTVAEIRKWHQARGFLDIGYHYVIHPDGRIERGRQLVVGGAHCTGRNATSIGICYIGGVDAKGRAKDTRTTAQRQALRDLVTHLRVKFNIKSVHGHNYYAAKACPCFKVPEEL